MIKRSTFSDLLSYAYNESDMLDSDSIQRSLDGDPLLNAEYAEINNLISLLNEATPEVPQQAIKKILQFC
jgi:hypothetical protein